MRHPSGQKDRYQTQYEMIKQAYRNAVRLFSVSKNLLARERPRLPCVRGAVKIGSRKPVLTEGLFWHNVAISPKTNANTLGCAVQSLSHFALFEAQNDSSLYTREPLVRCELVYLCD